MAAHGVAEDERSNRLQFSRSPIGRSYLQFPLYLSSMSEAPPKRYQLYCTRQLNGQKPEEELFDVYGSFLKAALAINEMADSAINLEPKKWKSRSEFLRACEIRVYDTLTKENIWIGQ